MDERIKAQVVAKLNQLAENPDQMSGVNQWLVNGPVIIAYAMVIYGLFFSMTVLATQL
jgi:hypothetical protein